MKKFLAGLIVGIVLGAMGGAISTSAQSAPPAEAEAKPTLRIITKVTDKDAVGSLFIAGIKRDLSEGMDADVSTGDDLDTDDPSGPELRVMTIVEKGSSEEAIVAVLTYHTQGTDGPPVYLATAEGSVDADGAQEAADEVSRMIVLTVVQYEGEKTTKPQAVPQKNKIPPSHPDTAIMKIRGMA